MKRGNGVRQATCASCSGTGQVIMVSGEWARQQRRMARLSLREVARRMGFSAPYICDLELGRRPMSGGLWERYSKALAEKA